MQKKRRGLAAVLLFVLFYCLTGCRGRHEVYEAGLETEWLHTTETEMSYTETDSEKQTQGYSGYVYVCGAVSRPGVYPLYDGMRIFEAVELAGGFLPEADETWLNQASPMQDGQQLYVYTKEETRKIKDVRGEGTVCDLAELWPDGSTGGKTQEQGKVNLNTADVDELMTLPGIGEAKAQAVVQYRAEHGAFSSIEEIRQIPGIKQAVFSKIKDQITV
ncbi:MAG: ComEA family DNA-binding protein [Lachnospiraceae bacterium]|nr:ComEA family DNA-binding protein [Lachnospiraceae bacterium]